VVKIGSFYMEEDNPKKTFECFEESDQAYTDIYYHRGQGLLCHFLSPNLLTSDDLH
jgi:hypothetical protein